MSILLIGTGGVGWAAAQKCAQYNNILGDITIASRTIAKCDALVADIKARANIANPLGVIRSASLDVNDINATVSLIREIHADLVINLGSPETNLPVMEACVQAQASYIDTSVNVDLCSAGQQVPQAYDQQWAFRDRFKAAGITGLLSIGFDPGVVNVFAAYAKERFFDSIDCLDVLDVNAGDHKHKFATNFDPIANLTEIQGDSWYFEHGEWKNVPCHTRSCEFDFPEVGKFKLFSTAHDEIRSLAEFIPARKIEFWMGFGEQYLKYFGVLHDIGMLSPKSVTTVSGASISPLEMLKAVLPEPRDLAATYTGKTCIGTLISGTCQGRKRKVFIYNICDHQAAFAELGSQAISYTAAVPAVVAALLYFQGPWRKPGLWNAEQMPPECYLNLMAKSGLSWEIQELPA